MEVTGTLATRIFWPAGQSDADTASVIIDVAEDSFRFRPHDDAPFRLTQFYRGATVVGRERKAPVNAAGKMTIRLQWIDATEMHYRPSPLSKQEKDAASPAKLQAFKAVNHSYRQFFGATAAKMSHDFVGRAGSDAIPCRVFTRVDKPNEVFDTYARFVGDIEITVRGAPVNLNRWLIENGWAFPAFYVSMNDDEIIAVRELAAAAKRGRKGIWPYYSKTIGTFDFDLREPKKGETDILEHDKGKVIFPKLYRRQANWAARKKARIFTGALQRFLESQPDDCFETDDFLVNGLGSAKRRHFADFVHAGTRVGFDPADLVFAEAASKIIGSDGKLITQF